MRYEKENEHSNGSLIDDIGIMFHQLSNGDARSQGRNEWKRKYGHSPILLSWPETVTIIRFVSVGGKDWEVEELDLCIEMDFFGETGKLNLKACKTRNGLEGMDFFFGKGKVDASIGSSEGKTGKHFRWFYTYYTYTCDFQEIKR